MINMYTYKQPDSQEKIMIVDNNFSSNLKLTKESLDIKVRESLNQSSPKYQEFNEFDEVLYNTFDYLYFQNVRGEAVSKLEESQATASIYIKDYKLLIISDCGVIIGEISDVESDNTEEAEIMVRKFDGMYAIMFLQFDLLKEFYLKEYENIKAWQEKKANLINNSIALN